MITNPGRMPSLPEYTIRSPVGDHSGSPSLAPGVLVRFIGVGAVGIDGDSMSKSRVTSSDLGAVG